jgi:5,10-methylenetetrahydromethanopterin reductase
MISCAFATSLSSPEHIAVAEDLDYRRAWLYDTPQQSPDVWMTLARAAERTERIGLGPGVLVSTLRHPMVNAAGAAALCALAPGRMAVAFGTGFTGRRAMGQGAISWRYMRDYVTAFKGLLSGQVIEREGGRPGHRPRTIHEYIARHRTAFARLSRPRNAPSLSPR